MLFPGIFLPFFQSHSSPCSFLKNKNLIKEKIHESSAMQFIEVPFIYFRLIPLTVITEHIYHFNQTQGERFDHNDACYRNRIHNSNP